MFGMDEGEGERERKRKRKREKQPQLTISISLSISLSISIIHLHQPSWRVLRKCCGIKRRERDRTPTPKITRSATPTAPN
jgi:hypothetical protein